MPHKSLSRILRTFFAFAALSLLATLSASAQMVSYSQPYNGTTVNPCNGESVTFSGTIHFHEKTQVSADGRQHFVANNNFSASGLGATTRVTYNLNGNLHTNSKFPSFPITFRQRTRFISTSSAAPSFFLTVVFHVNGNGVQTQVSNTASCNG